MSDSPVFVARQLKWVAIAAATWACTLTSAQTLSELVETAKGYDAPIQAARKALEAAQATADQSQSSLWPSVGLGGGYKLTDTDQNPDGKARSVTLSATQALYNRGNSLLRDQAALGIESAQLKLLEAEQALMANVSQAYFDLLGARAQLKVISASKKAATEQLERAKRNFEVGTSTITDTHEAQAQYDRIVASEIAAQNDERVKQLALDQLVGKNNIQPHDLRADVALPSIATQSVDEWVKLGLMNSPQIKLVKIGLRSAAFEIDKAQAKRLPSVDLKYEYNDLKVIGRNCQLGSPTVCSNQALTLSASVPLFAGYAIENGIKAAVANQQSTQAQLEGAQRNVSQGIRQAYFGLLSGKSQIQALQAAVASSQSALDANKTGYDVGVRINADVLNAQSQLYQTEAALTTARYSLLTGGIKLRQAAGTLSKQDLAAIDALLQP